MKVISAQFIARRTAIVGWLTIFTQAALPLSFAYTPLVHATTSQAPSSKWYQSGGNNSNGQSLFDNHDDTRASALTEGDAAGMARSAATGAVNNTVEEWLSQFGTARVQLNLDEKFKTDGSEADLLVPLYEDQNNVLFTQLGFRHKDDRNTGNLGIGVRHFTGDWMLGANTFYDNDFSGNNRRFGIGVEAWRDYLKLSGNSYIRLSDWHQSRDFEDYDERPANGYDIRAEGWLPAFPQLGAKLMYEQYQGDEVALFGKDNRQKDPWAFTGGVNYTPVPLLTLGAQHRAGKDGQSDSQLSMQVNYRLGESLSKQLDPSLVGASRTLSGSRYDLVERNNSIVLDYRKQEVVTLVLPEKTTGKSRSTIPVTFEVQTKHPLQRIDWDAPSLIAAGGSLTQTGSNQLSVTLPPYQAAGSNVYRFTGVAYDVKGNSGSASAEVHVDVGEVLPGATRVSANPTSLAADGKSTSTLSIELFDDQGNAVPGMVKTLAVSIHEAPAAKQPSSRLAAKAATVGPVKETSPGVYQAVITAGTRVGTATVSSKFNGIALPDISLTESADAATGQIPAGAILTTVDNSVANNTAMNQVKATITDAGGNPLANTRVTFTLSGSAVVAAGSSLTATTDDQGVVSLSLVDRVAETVKVTATLDNGNAGSIDTHFIADSSSATVSNGDVTVDKTAVVANNVDAATFSAVVKDANGNPVPNFTVNWSSDKGTLSEASSTTNANGIATVTLKNSVAEAVQVTVQAGSSNSITAPVVNFTADSGNLSTANSALAVTPATIVANGVEASAITLTLKDANNNAVSGQNVSFTSSLSGTTVGSVTDNGDGTYTAQLTGVTAGTAAISANIGGSAFAVAAVNVTLTADSSNLSAASSTITAAPATIVANGTAASTVTLSLKDANNNAVSGQTVTFTSSLTNSSVGRVTDNGDGTYTAQLTGITAGTANVTANIGGNPFGAAAANVTLTADSSNLSTTNSSLAATPATIVADGTTASTVTLSIKDANNNAVSGQAVTFTSSLGGSSIGSVRDNGDGTYSAPLTGITAGTATITATVNGTSFGVSSATVTLTADSSNLSTATSTLAAAPATIVANGTAASTITLTLKDANDNLVSGQAVTFNSNLGGGSFGAVQDHGDGTYSATFSGITAGAASITANVGGTPFGVSAATVTLTADSSNLSTSSSALAASPTSIVADGAAASTITLSLKDANNNAVSGQTVTFSSSLANSNIGTVTDNGNGTYSAPLTGTTAGTATITTQVGGNNFAVTAASVTLTAGAIDASSSTLAVNKDTIDADDTTGSAITFTARDVNNNPISGLTVAFTTALANASITSVIDNNNGTYTANLSGTQAGTANIVTQVAGASVAGASTSVTITPGGWNPAQTSPIIALSQPSTLCTFTSGVYKRNYLEITPLPLYDTHGNELAASYAVTWGGNGPTTLTTVTGATVNLSGAANATVTSGTPYVRSAPNDAYSTLAACEAEGIATTSTTVTVTSINDGFSTKPVNRQFVIGSGR